MNDAKTRGSKEDRPFDYELTRKFREGVKRVCMARAWNVIESHFSGDTDYEIADDLKIYRTNVSHYRQGRMEGGALFTFMTYLGIDCHELDDLPSVCERALSGYQIAIHFLRTNEIYPRDEERISYEIFMTVSIVSANGDYRKGCENQDWDWGVIAEQVRSELAEMKVKVPFEALEELEKLRDRWMTFVVRCLKSIPYTWL